MEKLVLNENGKEINLLADKKYNRGIYLANSPKSVINNIMVLDITFDSEPEYVNQHRFTQLGKWFFLTSYVDKNYKQYIITPSATQEEFGIILREFRGMPDVQQALRMAFSLRGGFRLG